MSTRPIFQANRRYSFSDYFNLPNPPEEIIAELGYQLKIDNISFPLVKSIETGLVDNLKNFYYQLLPKISTNSEVSKREFMIAPVLHAVMLHVDAKLNVEYPIDVNEKLNGILDYLIRSKQELVVIEAKKGDLDRGFTQLAAELIALDQYEEENSPEIIYGAISIGEVWRFTILQRNNKTLIKDINLFRFPQDAQELIAVLLGIFSK